MSKVQSQIDAPISTAPDARAPALRPSDSATLIIIDRSGKHPKMLMGRRHDGHKFMPSQFVFPGGRVEPSDRQMSVAGSLHPRAEQALMERVSRPSWQRCRALALAAIRETFEETGLMLGSKDYGAPESVPTGPWAAFQERGIFPELDTLQFVARAITPPKRVKRFDARFFAVDRDCVADSIEGVVGPDSELVELAWVTFTQAQKLDLPGITRRVLHELENRIAAGFIHELPVPFFHERNGRSLQEWL